MALAIFVARAQVTFERIRHAESEPGNWLTYSGDYSAHRYSALDQITPQNVKNLRPLWVHQIDALDKAETTPLVVEGVMYVTESPSNVVALDTRTGRPMWSFLRAVPKDVRLCCGQVNRGVALLGDLVFVGTVDAHLIALDAKTGSVRWDVTVANYKTGHAITAAPLAVKDKVVIGIAGGEFGIRGFVDAYDANTGKQAWRFWTVPAKGEPGNETWAGDSWKTGAASTWVTGSYDPDLNTVYWGTGNPGPDWNGDVRGGDNLYSDCLVALDADTGVKKWHFQYTPHDQNDWDSTQTPALVEGMVKGQPRKMVVLANRNGFYYALDRVTGKFIAGRPYVKQTWATGLDEAGRPMRIPNAEPTVEGKLIWPSLGGGSNWYSSTYNPRTDLYYVNVKEMGAIYIKGDAEYKPGAQFNGGGQTDYRGEDPYGAVRALDVATGQLRWEYKLHSP